MPVILARARTARYGPAPRFPGAQAYPFWSLIIIAIDMFIIWALLAKTGDAG